MKGQGGDSLEEGHVLGDMLKGIPCKQRAKASWTDGTTGTTAEKTVSYCQKQVLVISMERVTLCLSSRTLMGLSWAEQDDEMSSLVVTHQMPAANPLHHLRITS